MPRGRPPISEHVEEAVGRLMNERPRRHPVKEIADQFGIAVRTAYKLARRAAAKKATPT